MDIAARFTLLLERHPLVFAHLVLALGAMAVGALVLLRRQGDTGHRWLGWTWVALMGGVALSAAFIRDHHLPNVHGITPIHLLVVYLGWQLPRAVWFARRGLIERHRQAMRGLYQGGCLIAFAFTLLPGRFLGTMLWRQLGALG